MDQLLIWKHAGARWTGCTPTGCPMSRWVPFHSAMRVMPSWFSSTLLPLIHDVFLIISMHVCWFEDFWESSLPPLLPSDWNRAFSVIPPPFCLFFFLHFSSFKEFSAYKLSDLHSWVMRSPSSAIRHVRGTAAMGGGTWVRVGARASHRRAMWTISDPERADWRGG